jgi:hypothetical protein
MSDLRQNLSDIRSDLADFALLVDELEAENADLKAKLAKAVEALQTIKMRAMPHKDDDDKDRKRQLVHIHSISNTTLKELTGGKDE